MATLPSSPLGKRWRISYDANLEEFEVRRSTSITFASNQRSAFSYDYPQEASEATSVMKHAESTSREIAVSFEDVSGGFARDRAHLSAVGANVCGLKTVRRSPRRAKVDELVS